MKDTILLPRVTKDGRPRISYSQYATWKSKNAFNLNTEGKIEYFVKYFMDKEFTDKGWGQFGKEVESYICERKFSDKFSEKEKNKLQEITPLGIYQEEFEIDFGGFVFNGIIDDRLKDWSMLRDYKTASKNSAKKYKYDNYYQLDFYAMKSYEITGKIPIIEVCIIERKGNVMFGGGRDNLKVGDNIWYVIRETSLERLKNLKEDLFKVVNEISEYYKLYLELNNS